MSNFRIKLDSIDEAIDFTNTCNHFEEDIDLYAGSVCRDAKSLNSNIEFIGRNDLFVKININNKNIINSFEKSIEKWIVEG